MAEYEQISKELKVYKQLETDGLITEEDYNAVKKKDIGYITAKLCPTGG